MLFHIVEASSIGAINFIDRQRVSVTDLGKCSLAKFQSQKIGVQDMACGMNKKQVKDETPLNTLEI